MMLTNHFLASAVGGDFFRRLHTKAFDDMSYSNDVDVDVSTSTPVLRYRSPLVLVGAAKQNVDFVHKLLTDINAVDVPTSVYCVQLLDKLNE